MFLNALLLISTILSSYGMSDYCDHPAIIEFIRTFPMGKYTYATSIGLLLSIITSIIYAIDNIFKNKFLDLALKIILTISLPILIFISLFFWIMFIKDPSNFRGSHLIKYNIYTPMFTNICQHLVPLIGLLCIFINQPISTSRKFHFIFQVILILYSIVVFHGHNSINLWPYPFMAHFNILHTLVFFISAGLMISLVFEVLIFIEKLRRRIRLRNIVDDKKKH